MLLLLAISLFSGSVFADIRGYRQGLGTVSVFPDIKITDYSIQAGLRNFYGLSGTYLFGISYNRQPLSIQATFMNIASYYRTASLSFAIRKESKNGLSAGTGFSFIREFIPYTENRIVFALSSGIKPFSTLSIHTGVYGVPVRTRIPILIMVTTLAGKTGILLEGEKGLPLKLLLFQRFNLTERIRTYLSFSTSPNKLSIGITMQYHNLLFEPFSEIHDILGQSGGIIVEYAPSQSYN